MQGLAVSFAKVPVSTPFGVDQPSRRRAKVPRLMDRLVEPPGVSSDENPRSIGSNRVENNCRALCRAA